MSEPKRTAYLDNGDSTQLLPEVLEAMMPYFRESYGNPASLHQLGLDAETAIDEARQTIASLIGARSRELFFTSCATESNNIALEGLRRMNPDRKHVIISPIEHASVRNVVRRMAKDGHVEYDELAVDGEGRVDPDSLRELIRDDTLFVSIIHGNNEIGTIQDLRPLAEIAHEHGAVFHSDCAQTLGKIPVNVKQLGVDLASFNSHKLHGPKGAGALFVKRRTKLRRLFEGSPQESGLRPGTENVPAIVGFATAAEIAVRDMDEVMPAANELTVQLAQRLLEIPHVRVNGPEIGGPERLPGNLNLTFKYIEGEAVLMSLNYGGVYVSSGSACSSKSLVPSHVLTGIGLLHEEAHGSIRYTLSRLNTQEDVDLAVEQTNAAVDRLRAMTAFIPEQHSERESDDAKTFYRKREDKL
ncbi:MAG: Cysteine desulfurase IscS [Calditrichaeota bacterium]|nr:Cysteine desulfurase IscS [Calditrichota bacterium]